MVLPEISLGIGPGLEVGNIGNRMEEFAAAGLKYIALDAQSLLRMQNDAAFRAEMLRQAEHNGLIFRDAHAPHSGGDTPGARGETETVVATQTSAIETAASIGVTTLTIHAGGRTRRVGRFAQDSGVFEFADLPGARIRTVAAMEKLLPVAEKEGVIIAMENLFLPATTAAFLTPVAEEFNSPWLGLCYDSGHALLLEPQNGKVSGDIAEWIRIGWDDDTVVFQEYQLETMLPWVVTTHLHDNDGRNDQHFIPGNGVADWRRIIADLKRAPRLKTLQGELAGKLYEECDSAQLVSAFDIFKS